MKITKDKLRQLIKESLIKSLDQRSGKRLNENPALIGLGIFAVAAGVSMMIAYSQYKSGKAELGSDSPPLFKKLEELLQRHKSQEAFFKETILPFISDKDNQKLLSSEELSLVRKVQTNTFDSRQINPRFGVPGSNVKEPFLPHAEAQDYYFTADDIEAMFRECNKNPGGSLCQKAIVSIEAVNDFYAEVEDHARYAYASAAVSPLDIAQSVDREDYGDASVAIAELLTDIVAGLAATRGFAPATAFSSMVSIALRVTDQMEIDTMLSNLKSLKASLKNLQHSGGTIHMDGVEYQIQGSELKPIKTDSPGLLEPDFPAEKGRIGR